MSTRRATILLLGTLAALPGRPGAAAGPAAPAWRLGFADGGRRFLEVPPTDALCEEKDRLLLAEMGNPCEVEPADRTPIPLALSKAEALQRSGLASRREWWVLGLDGRAERVSFPRLVALYAEAGAAGCYFQATEAAAERVPAEGPTEENLFFAFSSEPVPRPAVRRATGDWELFDRAEGKLPARYVDLLRSAELRASLGRAHTDFAAELTEVFTQTLSARLPGRPGPEPLRLVGWVASGPRTGELATAWALVGEGKKGLQVVAAVRDGSDDDGGQYRAEVAAAVDLTGDGADELVLSASYWEGGGFKVFGWLGGKLVQLYDGGYFGL